MIYRLYKFSIIILIIVSFIPTIVMLIYHIINFELQLCYIYMFLSFISMANLSSYITNCYRDKLLLKMKNIMYIILNLFILFINFFMCAFIILTL